MTVYKTAVCTLQFDSSSYPFYMANFLGPVGIAKSVTCPVCGALPGYRCVEHKGGFVPCHVERGRAARWQLSRLDPQEFAHLAHRRTDDANSQ